MKIYKLRALTNCDDLSRIKEIIETGKFWCSQFSEMNDPMEGVYQSTSTNNVKDLLNEKNKYKICSFSGKKGFENPVMWGYYAGGFKGVAIELEVGESKNLQKVDYVCDVKLSNDVRQILTSKLYTWQHEDEYRFLNETNENLNMIGKINKVYIGNPYNNINNEEDVIQNNKTLQKYREMKNELEKFLERKKVAYVEVSMKGNMVKPKERTVHDEQ